MPNPSNAREVFEDLKRLAAENPREARAKLAALLDSGDSVLEENRFEFVFNGPASLFRETRRYGIRMANMVPTLLLCEDWEMRATIHRFNNSNRQPQLIVSSCDRYRSSLKALPCFDSALECGFAEKWGSVPREGWTLQRESEPRFIGQKAFFPDFTFTHNSGVKVLFEIIGHWTAEYLTAKKTTLKQFKGEPLLLALREDATATFDDLGIPLVTFKSAIKIDSVIAALRRFLLTS
jgi:hypothetical protein